MTIFPLEHSGKNNYYAFSKIKATIRLDLTAYSLTVCIHDTLLMLLLGCACLFLY